MAPTRLMRGDYEEDAAPRARTPVVLQFALPYGIGITTERVSGRERQGLDRIRGGLPQGYLGSEISDLSLRAIMPLCSLHILAPQPPLIHLFSFRSERALTLAKATLSVKRHL